MQIGWQIYLTVCGMASGWIKSIQELDHTCDGAWHDHGKGLRMSQIFVVHISLFCFSICYQSVRILFVLFSSISNKVHDGWSNLYFYPLSVLNYSPCKFVVPLFYELCTEVDCDFQKTLIFSNSICRIQKIRI